MMKKIKVIIMALACLGLLAACQTKTPGETTSETASTAAPADTDKGMDITAPDSKDSETTAPDSDSDNNDDLNNDEGAGEILSEIQVELLSEKSVETFDNVKEVIVDPAGTSFVFWTKEKLNNIMLIGVEYNGDQFLEGKVYCSLDSLDTGDAIVLTGMMGETFPNLKLTYTDAQGRPKTFFVLESGRDGRPFLLTEDGLLYGEE